MKEEHDLFTEKWFLRRKVGQKFFTSDFFSEKDENRRIEGAKNAGWRKTAALNLQMFWSDTNLFLLESIFRLVFWSVRLFNSRRLFLFEKSQVEIFFLLKFGIFEQNFFWKMVKIFNPPRAPLKWSGRLPESWFRKCSTFAGQFWYFYIKIFMFFDRFLNRVLVFLSSEKDYSSKIESKKKF